MHPRRRQQCLRVGGEARHGSSGPHVLAQGIILCTKTCKTEGREAPKPHPTWTERAAREVLRIQSHRLAGPKGNKDDGNRQPGPGNLESQVGFHCNYKCLKIEH